VPILGWIRSYDPGWLRGDLIAGVAVAALIVPKNLGYAGIAGIPLQNGLYAAAAGAILYAIFGTSRQVSTGPSSGLAAVAASAVAVAGITGIQGVASFVALITVVSACCTWSLRCSRWDGSRSSSPGRSSPASSSAPPSTS
jgi:sulfate permease, SulP family